MHAKQNFPIGISDFTRVIQKGCTFVDKTMFIKEIIDDGADVILITRPRRFGKTLAMSMLEAFLSIDGADVFGGLSIEKETQFCAAHHNKYPVIFITFKDAKGSTYDGVFKQIQNIFSKLYDKHLYLLKGNTLSQHQREKFQSIVNETLIHPIHLAQALSDLISYIHKYTRTKPVVLIDEYDSPIHIAYANGFYDKIAELMRGMLGAAFKDNISLEKAVLTGIARVAKESMFSGLNNVQCYTMLDAQYAQYFGFTQDEVEALLPSPDLIEPIKKWYNGYKIGAFQIYNPWSIMHCLNNDATMDPYWINTSDNALVYELIGKADDDFKIKIEKLIQGIPQEQTIYDHLTFGDLDTNKNAVWALLLHAGYLNVASRTRDEFGKQTTFIEIPNREVLWLYTDIVERWFYLNGNEGVYRDFIKSLDSHDPTKFFKIVIAYISSAASYFDLSENTPEYVFHIFMMGLLIGFRGKYDVTSNREAGDGRYDVIMIPKDPASKAILMEFKVCKSISKLQKTADSALAQIINKNYTDAFKGEVLVLGMAFCGKKMVGTGKYLEKTA